ncbi:hypothetical protein [Pseudovibrio sp. Tun.PSC04-5.I4]|uniref:hypothetical protein n=1 Tax=Pseudovibrio sp. Tun.PSC04-5.I4 TaxID=1798213 RepID=UPI00088CAC91|nr:hypothetical protein [Pseudovibrio sp. Tun.PSC04-5.I4]SDR14538.1 hypothetical protein SAMN04515695_3003 [Pseudovibrio sp. Tun.PSC04-5.I4]
MGIDKDKWIGEVLKCLGVNPVPLEEASSLVLEPGQDQVQASGQDPVQTGDPEQVEPMAYDLSSNDEPVPDFILPEDGSLKAAADVMAIAEREVGSGDGEIKFTGFSSCIGIVVRENNKVRGVHLAVVKPDGNPFNKEDAAKVLASLGTYTEAFIVGQIGVWTNPANLVSDAYKVLEDGVQSGISEGGIYNAYELGQGVYGAEIDPEDSNLVPTF